MLAFLLTHLWQSTLVLLGAWVLARACKRNAAAVRYWIWFVASVKFLVPLALLQQFGDRLGRSLPEPLPVDAALVESASAVFVPTMPRDLATSDAGLSQILLIAAAIWALGASLLFLRWFLQWCSVRARLACAPEASVDLPAPVRLTSSDLPTGVFGIFRPVVILPREVMHSLSQAQLRAVLAHEICHIRRHDNLTAAIHHCVQILFWFYPPVWWIGANLLREREAACDEEVVDEGHEQEVYAESILSACRLGVMARLSTVAASTGGDLNLRLSSIMSEERARPITNQRFTVLFAAATLLGFAPLAAGVANGAFREASDAGPVTFEAVGLTPSRSGWWPSAQFDPANGRLRLKNYSLLQLIVSAYPCSIVNDETAGLDRIRYDIDVQWRGEAGTSERHLYRALLRQILQNNSNLEVHVRDLH
ncbi:MAG TPA: M56 family metallopeptidase [Steroidobacteraceae bacterium]|nr:M56 family metallopeptidase [Steroidobacteraceae bacterium]